MKLSKKLISVLLALIVPCAALAAAPLTAFAEESQPYFATGTCGSPNAEDIEYYLFDDGSIAFFGTGEMENYAKPAANTPAAPWYLNNPMEALLGSKIAIEDGVTTVGNYAFYLPAMYTVVLQTYNVDLPNSLTTIGVSAFENQNKLEKISIPQGVTSIGDKAFYGCTKLAHVDVYGDPANIYWGEDIFSNNVTIHVKPEYANELPTLNSMYNPAHMEFEANLSAENLIDDGVKRNIKAYMGQESSRIFCGAAPFVVVGTFSGDKKSVTRASNGFASCVKIGSDYYVHTNNNSRNLNKATIALGGVASSLSADAHPSLKLRITYEYVGTNIVKMIYHLENTGGAPIDNVMLGGTGDIKIGADDTAKIEPLNDGNGQVGFYMKSTNAFDRDESGNYATLGFIGKGVDINSSKQSPDATFFYGKADANITSSAVGAYQLRLMPERIFDISNEAQTEGPFPASGGSVDSGMSYFWNIGTLAANETYESAVLFSVYGTGADGGAADEGQEMIADVEATYLTVTWKDGNGSALYTEVVKEGETPVYNGETPAKSPDADKAYKFNGTWKDENGDPPGAVTADTVYTAQFDDVVRTDRLFKAHGLSLRGDIGVLFCLDKEEVEKATPGSTAVVHFKWNVVGEEKTSDFYFPVKTASSPIETRNGKEYYVVRCNVPAAEMSYTISATAYFDGVEHWDKDSYSVRQYCMTIIRSADGTFGESHSKLVDLAKKMLNYGAKSQVVFDRCDVPLANHEMASADQAIGTVTQSDFDAAVAAEPQNAGKTRSKMREGTSDFGLSYYTATVVFLTKTSLRHYYTVSDTESHATSYYINDEPGSKKLTAKDNFLYAEFTDIPAAELDVLQCLSIGDKDYYFSVLDYARAMFAGGKTQAERDLAAATYWYNNAANAYFGV